MFFELSILLPQLQSSWDYWLCHLSKAVCQVEEQFFFVPFSVSQCGFPIVFPQVAIVVLGNKIDLSEQRQVDAEVAQQWAKSEKVKLWEVTVTDRRTLIEPFTLLASKLSQPQSKSSFPLPGRKNKGNSNSEN